MGEVYRARDTKLNRDVALKTLLPEVATDPERLARFAREAQVLASLNHPHIAHIYGLEDSTDTPALVMELVEGPTLADRIPRGPIPIDEALSIAKQIAEALEAAHEQGIIHRDLKPANIKIKDDGTVKVLDFGLAKALEPAGAGAAARTGGAGNNLTQSPTITTPALMTGIGVILGTAAYMSPEQAKGRPADRRSDVWAFGCVLYEMLTGTRAFKGDDVPDTLAHVLRGEPEWTALPLETPRLIIRLLRRCLEKDPRQRVADLSSARLDIRDALSAESHTDATTALARRRSRWIPLVAVVATAALAAGVVTWLRNSRPPAAGSIQFTISPPSGATFVGVPGGGTGIAVQMAVSPDGRSVVFVANDQNGYQLWLRPIGGLDTHPIAGTQAGAFPFWSPDSRYIGFFAGGKLKKVSVAGGIPSVLCDAVAGRGGSWNGDNVIVFAPSTTGGLQRVSAAGGAPSDASALDTTYGETSNRFPWFLPDGRHFLYTATIGTCCPASKPGRLKVGILGSMESKTLMQAESAALYSDGYLLFKAGDQVTGTLMGQAFDAASQSFRGEAFPLVQAIGSEGSRYISASASSTGVLLYGGGSGRPVSRLTWFDRTGHAQGGVGPEGEFTGVALSPDDRHVAAAAVAGTPENMDIFVFDGVAHTQTRFTFDPEVDSSPIWSPDGTEIIFRATRGRAQTLQRKAASGTAKEETVLTPQAQTAATPNDWSRDGRYVLFTRNDNVTGSADIWVLPMSGDRKPTAFLQTPSNETDPVFSPDGKWIAYSSTENAQPNIFVQPFPATGGKSQISANGGFKPIWSRDGKEIFYISLDNQLTAVAVDTASGFQARSPQVLFPVTTLGTNVPGRQYDVSRDGQRFLVNFVQQQSATMPLTVVVNWPSTIQK
jgi:Tol biopolymer transport system component